MQRGRPKGRQNVPTSRNKKYFLTFFKKSIDKYSTVCYNIKAVENAAVAQLVEHMLGKHEVAGPTPASSSKRRKAIAFLFLCSVGRGTACKLLGKLSTRLNFMQFLVTPPASSVGDKEGNRLPFFVLEIFTAAAPPLHRSRKASASYLQRNTSFKIPSPAEAFQARRFLFAKRRSARSPSPRLSHAGSSAFCRRDRSASLLSLARAR